MSLSDIFLILAFIFGVSLFPIALLGAKGKYADWGGIDLDDKMVKIWDGCAAAAFILFVAGLAVR